MTRFVVGVVCVAVSAGPAAFSQEIDSAVLEQGQQIYEENCALCHMPDGAGDPPTFPALSGNEQLGDLSTIVTNIHQGQGNMPPFPEMPAEEVAAVSTYIRNTWGNDFGGVTADEVAALLEGIEQVGELASIWDGVYTEAQAERGEADYTGVCSSCHGRRLDGAPDDPDMKSTPPVARAKFLREWDGQTLATLYEYTRATMPVNNPGFMSDQQYIDIVAYMLASSNMPAGEEELPTDPASLAHIVIEQEE